MNQNVEELFLFYEDVSRNNNTIVYILVAIIFAMMLSIGYLVKKISDIQKATIESMQSSIIAQKNTPSIAPISAPLRIENFRHQDQIKQTPQKQENMRHYKLLESNKWPNQNYDNNYSYFGSQMVEEVY